MVLVAAGDIASNNFSQNATAALLTQVVAANPATVVAALGDLAYDNGSAADFADRYEPTWGRHKGRTRPSPGNHDYVTRGASAYFDYFGAAAGPRGEGYRRMIEASVAKRAGTPDEVANVAALLMGPDGEFITGSDVLMDGGVTATFWYGDL